MIALLVKASFIVAAVLLFYKGIIEKESFFAANRVYLLLGLVLSFMLPFVSLPKLMDSQGMIAEAIDPSEKIQIPLDQPVVFQNHGILEQTTIEKITSDQVSAVPSLPPTEIQATVTPAPKRSFLFWVLCVYFFGVIIFSLNLLTQIISLFIRVTKSKDLIPDGNCTIVTDESIKDPCSFFKYIFINPTLYEFDVYEQIIAHEKIHVQQRHSLDLILAEIAGILLWFNPFIWKMRKEIEKNIEYQTDQLLLDGEKVEKTSYQLNLLKIATHSKPLAVTTHYNQSVIKQRILKMNTKKSNPHSYWKYTFIFPLLFGLILCLNKPVSSFAKSNKDALAPASITSVTPEPQLEKVAETPTPQANPSIQPKSKLTGSLNSCKKLLEAIRNEDLAKVKELLKVADPNCEDKNPDYEIIKTLENGMTMRRTHARTPIVAAARTGNLAIAKLLLAAGFNLKEYSQRDETPLVSASHEGHTEFVKFLLDQGVKINEISIGQSTALHAAATNGQLETATYLITQGAKVNIMTQGQGTPLNAAARNNQLGAMNLLLDSGAEINAQNDGNGSALNGAARNGHNQAVELLLSKGAQIDAQTQGQGSALNGAARNGHAQTVALLLEKGANPNLQNDGQGSALHGAARNGHNQAIEVLLAGGANIDAQTQGQGSALNGAARNGHMETVKFLLKKGANINVQNDGHGSALNAAARNGHLNIVKLLLAEGAEVNQYSNGQGTALTAAKRNGHRQVARFLESAGAN